MKTLNLGIGIDIVSIQRIASLNKEHPAFVRRVFSARELDQAASLPEGPRRQEFLAGRFAVKEAFCKSVGAEKPIDLADIECLRSESGAPALHLRATAAKAAAGRTATVSISHDGGFAVAVVQISPATHA